MGGVLCVEAKAMWPVYALVKVEEKARRRRETGLRPFFPRSFENTLRVELEALRRGEIAESTRCLLVTVTC